MGGDMDWSRMARFCVTKPFCSTCVGPQYRCGAEATFLKRPGSYLRDPLQCL